MICPMCHGQRTVLVDARPQPCPECAGRGEVYCCEGEQVQPGPAERAEPLLVDEWLL